MLSKRIKQNAIKRSENTSVMASYYDLALKHEDLADGILTINLEFIGKQELNKKSFPRF